MLLSVFSFGITIFLGLVGFVSVLLMYALRAIVLEGTRPVAALRRGWQLLKQHLKHSILLFLLGAALGTAGGLLVLIVTAVAAIPAIIAWAISYSMDFTAASTTIAALLTLPAIVALTLAIAANNTYFSAYWTKAYLGLAGDDASAGPDGSQPAPVGSPA